MKQAVRQLAGCRSWTESEAGRRGRHSGYLRADVRYMKRGRDILVECETQPDIKRLLLKAERRRNLPYRTKYILVVPATEYRRCDWDMLRGGFDQIYVYSDGVVRLKRDLSQLGFLRDVLFDLVMPIINNRRLLYLSMTLQTLRKVDWSIRYCPLCLLMALPHEMTCRERYCPLHQYRWFQPLEGAHYIYRPHIEDRTLHSFLRGN